MPITCSQVTALKIYNCMKQLLIKISLSSTSRIMLLHLWIEACLK